MRMGIEKNMRRWPVYIMFAVCILLTLSLCTGWRKQTDMQTQIDEISTQLQACSKMQRSCMDDSLTLLEQKERLVTKVNSLEKQLVDEVANYKEKVLKTEKQVNRTLVDVGMCKTELQSLNNLQLTKSAMLETLRLEKETLSLQVEEKKQKIEELEAEIMKLKAAATTKMASNPSAQSKVTPAAAPPKQSPSLQVQNEINEPVLENDAKEDFDDTNANNDFDSQLK